ncbi:9-O-acetylesterase [Prevotella herbatica]|uniref:9-O-acetylesterase n=1 Tax=Prevotella herbatica TaxID=2801997 RepID=A0ABN6EHC8_9BACT|nr:sialate O-acetylesterase [Prevotella herbatica]BCS85345.1 9-O-acetylesterase [Prevotella herbatica]
MLRRILFFAALSTITLGSQAKVRLPHIIGDNMILQQDSEARLWGWDTPGKTVKVNVSWSKESYSAKTDSKGKWIVGVKTPKASYTPLSITFNDGDRTTISNVLSGEVWVCAGQSNMEMPVKGFGNCPVEGYNKAVMNANEYKGIHYVKIPSVMSTKPLDDAQCDWKVIGPQTVGDASATGYFFAQAINKTLGIPVGLVMANKGGTRVESWLDRDYLEKNTTEPLDSMEMVKKFPGDYLRPLLWGNGTFSPILKYTVKGIIFYQGCSNVGDPASQYTKRLNDLVSQWRRDFKLGEIPFYFVQIAPYFNSDVNGDWGPKLREQQFNASKIIPNSGIVCIDDLVYPYESQQIHPSQKQQVGERLALQALNKTYGMKNIWCNSPEYKDMKISNDTCYVNLTNDYGAISRYEDIQGFEVAGADKVFHKANASYYWTKGLIITCPEVKTPVAVRYAFRNWGYGNVKNAALLPLFPFRTDNW